MKRSLVFLLILLLLPLPASHAQEEIPAAYTSRTKVASGYFATVSVLCLFDDYEDPAANSRLEETWQQVKAILEEIEQTVSASVPTSEIARFNALPQGGRLSVSPLTAELVELSRDMCQRTGGLYDPTVYPLVDLWGFSPRFTYGDGIPQPYDRQREDGTLPPPDEAYIEAFLRLVGMDGILLERDADGGYVLIKQTPSVSVSGQRYHAQLDLGGIAKGYAVDRVREILAEKGYEYGYFSCGSSSVCVLKSASSSAKEEGDPHFWLQINSPRQTPQGTGAYAQVSIMDCSLSSSGDYGRNYELGGERYCHIIDPRTGYPMNVTGATPQEGVCTVTLLSGSAAEDDALTTALCLMDLPALLDFINDGADGREIILVCYRNGCDRYEVVTNLSSSRIKLLDPAYVLASHIDSSGEVLYMGTLFEP